MDRLVGTNLSGLEFAPTTLPGTIFFDYVAPEFARMQYYQTKGMNCFRLPFIWERLQPTLFAPLDGNYLALIQKVVNDAAYMGCTVLLDLHNFAQWRGNNLGTSSAPYRALVDVWLRLSTLFKNVPNVAFGLMNEPANITNVNWIALAQRVVNAIRGNGANNLIMVASGGFSGVHDFTTLYSGFSSANLFVNFVDPANNWCIEVHQYCDSDFSGSSNTCTSPASDFTTMMATISTWAATNNKKLFLGEFGVANNTQCLLDLATLVNGTYNTNWIGYTYWTSGPWSDAYAFNINYISADAAQLSYLQFAM